MVLVVVLCADIGWLCVATLGVGYGQTQMHQGNQAMAQSLYVCWPHASVQRRLTCFDDLRADVQRGALHQVADM